LPFIDSNSIGTGCIAENREAIVALCSIEKVNATVEIESGWIEGCKGLPRMMDFRFDNWVFGTAFDWKTYAWDAQW
jgi:hypothetical protein